MTDREAGGPSADVGRAGWERDFSLLWSASAVSQLGSVNAMLAAPLLALFLTGSPVFAGWVTAAGTLPRILLHLPVGVLVDYLDRRRVMIASLTVRAALAALLTCSVLAAGGETVMLPLIVAAQGVCLVFFTTAETTIVPRLVPLAHLPRAAGKNEARIHAAGLLGRPLGGLLFDLHRGVSFIVDAVASSLSVLALLKMRKQDSGRPAPRPRLRMGMLLSELRLGFSFLRRDRFLRHVLIVCTLANFLFQTLALVLVLLAHRHGLSNLVIGCLVATSGVGGVLGSLTASRMQDGLRTQTVIVVGAWAWLGLTLVAALIDHGNLFQVAFLLPLAWAGIGFTGAHINVALAVYQASQVPEELFGRVTGASRFFSGSAVPLGALTSGYLIAWFGTEDAVLLVATVIGVLASIITVMVLSQRKGADQGRDPRASRPWRPAGPGERPRRQGRAGRSAESSPRARQERSDLIASGRG